ncbi:MAG: nickel-dependent hydrogenase large subunit [Patescibacteria group bacterium]
MHDSNFDLGDITKGTYAIKLDEISKIEGAASLDIQITQGKVTNLKFSISEWKRFYTQAIQGKPATVVPTLVSRICGTCSNAHLLASIKAVENAYQITPSDQTMLLRKLLYHGLIIRDHALHLYIFALPDVFKKNSILDFDMENPVEHEFLDDAFAVKEVGNQLSIVVGGRSVHAPTPVVGGFMKLPSVNDLKKLIPVLVGIRPKIVKLIDLFAKTPFFHEVQAPFVFTSLVSTDFSYLQGTIHTSKGQIIEEKSMGDHLKAVVIPYSHARGFNFDGDLMMVGAIARLILGAQYLHPKTKETSAAYLKLFPTKNLFYNNLAQAIEILHSIDQSIELIENLKEISPEAPIKPQPKESVGVGLIEAPRGSLYYKLDIDQKGLVIKGEIVVPTGQNQVIMERAIREIVEDLLTKNAMKEKIIYEVEKFIRAFDPCMSCASHFLKVNWS